MWLVVGFFCIRETIACNTVVAQKMAHAPHFQTEYTFELEMSI